MCCHFRYCTIYSKVVTVQFIPTAVFFLYSIQTYWHNRRFWYHHFEHPQFKFEHSWYDYNDMDLIFVTTIKFIDKIISISLDILWITVLILYNVVSHSHYLIFHKAHGLFLSLGETMSPLITIRRVCLRKFTHMDPGKMLCLIDKTEIHRK